MATFQIKIKPTSGGPNIIIDTASTRLISDVKQAVTTEASIPATEQRLIYKGQVLKDDRTVESYGIMADHVVHMVKSKPPQTQESQTPAIAQPQSQPQNPSAPLGAAPLGFGGMTNAMPGGMGGLEGSVVQSMLQNPEVLRSMLQANPAIRELMNSNPEMAHILNNPQMLRESLALATNPSLMREQMRHSDRAMSNLESHPEGFNALRRMYENVQQPFQNAQEDSAGANPFASLFSGEQPGNNPSGATTTSQSRNTRSTDDAASTTPNTAPLPNPWAPSTGSQTTPGTTGGGLGALGSLGGSPGLGLGSGLGAGGMGGLNSQQTREAMSQLNNPQFRQAMSELMSTESGQQMFRNMANSNPQFRQLMEQNPAMRAALEDPEQMRRMMAPESLQAMLSMAQQLEQLGLGQGMPGMMGAGGGASPGPPGTGINLAALQSMLGGMGGGMPLIQPVANPEEAFASQLVQLQDMGFYDQQENIRVLQSTGGNVQAAVDRLLNQP